MQTARQFSEDRLESRAANHRVLNVLAMLLAIFRRKLSQFNDKYFRSATTRFVSKLIAASELLRMIPFIPAEDVAVEVYLERLSRDLCHAVLSPAKIGCEVFSDQGRLPINVCERLGFIIVELVLNASKYAFADRNNGVVRIEMTRAARRWCCTVSDNGIGMHGASTGRGLNTVNALVLSLKGRLIIRSGGSGTCVCVVLPDQSMPRGALTG
jgi:two-component sensor histidine kinase